VEGVALERGDPQRHAVAVCQPPSAPPLEVHGADALPVREQLVGGAREHVEGAHAAVVRGREDALGAPGADAEVVDGGRVGLPRGAGGGGGATVAS